MLLSMVLSLRAVDGWAVCEVWVDRWAVCEVWVDRWAEGWVGGRMGGWVGLRTVKSWFH
jgi:hypothetical protein